MQNVQTFYSITLTINIHDGELGSVGKDICESISLRESVASRTLVWSSTRIIFETSRPSLVYLLVLLDLLTFVALSSSSVIDYGSLFKMLGTSNFVVSDVLHLLVVAIIALFE